MKKMASRWLSAAAWIQYRRTSIVFHAVLHLVHALLRSWDLNYSQHVDGMAENRLMGWFCHAECEAVWSFRHRSRKSEGLGTRSSTHIDYQSGFGAKGPSSGFRVPHLLVSDLR